MSERKHPRKYISWAVLFFAAITLFLAQSSYWINHTVFNQQTFTEITTKSLLTDQSRDAIASTIVDEALADRPVLQKTVGSRAESFVSGLLGSDLSSQLVTGLTKKVYAYTTASDRQDIAVDLGGIKTPLSNVIDFAENQGREVKVDPNRIPERIVIIESDNFPNLSGLVKTMIWLGPIFWLSTIALFAGFIYMGRENYVKRIYIVGFTIVGVAVLGLFIAPFIPSSLAAAVPQINIRPVAETLASNFLAPFKAQMLYMLISSLGALLIFNQRFNLMHLLRSTEHTLKTKVKK